MTGGRTTGGSNRALAWYAGALAAFAVLRVAALPVYPLWEDETWTLEAGASTFRAAMRIQADDQTQPPLFYAILWAWRRLVPDTALWLRLVPCLAAIGTAVPVVALARALGFSRRATGLAIALAAGSGFLVAYGAELRPYALLALLGTASLALWARARDDGRSLAPLTVCNAALLHTHYFGVFVLVAEWLDALAGPRRRLRALTASAALSALTLGPWVAATIHRARITGARLDMVSWIPKPEPGDGLDVITESLGRTGDAGLDLALAAGVVVLIVLAASRRRATHGAALRLLALAATLPVLVALAASLALPRSVWVTRYVIAAVPPLLLLVAAAMDTFVPARATLVAHALALLPAAATIRSLSLGREKPRYDLVVGAIAARERGATAVDVFTSEGFPLIYAARAAQGGALRVHGESDVARVVADSGWFVWNEVHPPPGPPPTAILIRRGYRVEPTVAFGSLRDSLIAVRFARRGAAP